MVTVSGVFGKGLRWVSQWPAARLFCQAVARSRLYRQGVLVSGDSSAVGVKQVTDGIGKRLVGMVCRALTTASNAKRETARAGRKLPASGLA